MEPTAGTDWWAIAVQGIISGAMIVLGIVLAAAIDRSVRRRRAVEDAYHALVTPFNATTSGLIDPKANTSMSSPWKGQFDEAHTLLNEIMLQARGFRKAKKIREQARLIHGMILVANVHVNVDGHPLSPLFAMYTNTNDLQEAIFGPRDESLGIDGYHTIKKMIDEMPFPKG